MTPGTTERLTGALVLVKDRIFRVKVRFSPVDGVELNFQSCAIFFYFGLALKTFATFGFGCTSNCARPWRNPYDLLDVTLL